MIEAGQRTVKVPVSSRLNPVDREQAQMIAQYVFTPSDAKRLAASADVWHVRQVDTFGRIFVLKYKGCDIRLIYMRQMLDEVCDVGVPLPATAVHSSRQEWLSWNLVDEAEKVLERQDVMGAIQDSTQAKNAAYQQLADVRVAYEKQLAVQADDTLRWRKLAEAATLKLEKVEDLVKRVQADVQASQARLAKQVPKAKAEGVRMAALAFVTSLNILDKGIKKYNLVEADYVCVAFKDIVKNLNALEVEVIAPVAGETFDPNIHHAVEVLEMEAEHDGKIVECQALGVRQGQFILKAADVVVAKEKPKEVTA